MNYLEAMAAIHKGDIKQLYLISGEETYLTEKIERALLEKLLPDGGQDAIQRLDGDTEADDLAHRINCAPFFSERNLIIVRNTALFKEKKKSAEAAKQIKNSASEDKFIQAISDMPPYSALILETPEKIDKRRKAYKALAKYGCAIEVARIKPWEVKDWLHTKLRELGKQFDRAAHEYFLEATSAMNEISIGFLDQELEKLALYTDKKIIAKQDLLEALASIPEVSIFAMLEAVSDKNATKALRLLSEQTAAGEHPLRFVSMLSRHTRQLWQVKSHVQNGCSSRQIAEKLGLIPFVADKLSSKSKRFSDAALKRATMQLANADYRYKSGQADCATLERIIIELCV